MRSRLVIFSVISILICSQAAFAGPDLYRGDTAIYSSKSYPKPNVLFIIDNNSTMMNAGSGEAYNKDTIYPGTTYSTWSVYKMTGQANYVLHISASSQAEFLSKVTCTAAKDALLTYGTYTGGASTGLKSQGTCGNGGAGIVYLGNLLNYNLASTSPTSKSQIELIRDAVKDVVGGARMGVNFGIMIWGSSNKGGQIIYGVKSLEADADFNAFVSALNGITLLTGDTRPMAEALYDAGHYYRGDTALPIGPDSTFPPPTVLSCQSNFVVMITNGDSIGDSDPKLKLIDPADDGDYDDDDWEPKEWGRGSHWLDDVAKWIYETRADNGSPVADLRRGFVSTYTVLTFSPHKELLERAADKSHGRGLYRLASNAAELSKALTDVLGNIVVSVDTSFVAPVVPVSPESKTYSGSRVYMGFFYPVSKQHWFGNLKKYGLDDYNNIVDAKGDLANYVDLDGDKKDDRDGATMGATEVSGDFRATTRSYWTASGTADAGVVSEGGAGSVLVARDFTTNPRKLYTYTGSSTLLTDASNAFGISNASPLLNAAGLGVADAAERDKLINFVHGRDAYDSEDGDGNTTEKRTWFFGDILHSKPLIINYAAYSMSPASNEGNCSVNKTMIYVGANDGMVHAFQDCDGSEAWAFIPPDVLPYLNYFAGENHAYYADSSMTSYIYDGNNDGTISGGDKVILIFGLHRGGGIDSSPTKGYYYALDVSDPLNPKYLWSISSASTGFTELAESWSEPKLAKIKLGTSEKIAAIIGAGYDNCNEDARYGATQTYTGACVVPPTSDDGVVTSAGALAPLNPRGRGLYVIEVADIGGTGVPSFSNSGTKIWGYTNADSTSMAFSIPGEVSAVDTNYDGYVDRLYVGDLGGNLWRFNVGATSTASWTATKIFSANPGADSTVGRKIFYKPSVTIEPGYVIVYVGTGDREHPLNRAVMDRMYAVYDRGQTTAKTESDLVDVTENLLQAGTTAQVESILTALADPNNYGWYIKLNEREGEKVLAPPTLFSKVVYFTTHTPYIGVVTDPCVQDQQLLGQGRVYALDYRTGEAVVNYDKTNDSTSTTNTRATPVDGQVLLRSDRVMTLAEGIPSGIVVVIAASGQTGALVGSGGAILPPPAKQGGGIVPVYWRQR